MKKVVLVLIVVILLSAGCFLEKEIEEEEKDPKELYKELAAKAKKLPDGKYSYSLGFIFSPETYTTSNYAAMTETVNYNVDIYQLGEKRKTLMSFSHKGILNSMVLFETEDKMISCIEGAGPYSYYSQDGITCKYGNDITNYTSFSSDALIESFDEYIDELDLTLVGERKIAGRECYAFKIKINEEQLEKILEETESSSSTLYLGAISYGGTKVDYEICMDKEYGFNSHLDIIFSKYSQLSERESQILNTRMQLENFDPKGTKEDDFKIPVSFELSDVICENDKIKFKLNAFNPISGELTVKVGKIDHIANKETIYISEIVDVGNIEVGEEKEIEVKKTKELEFGSYAVSVCPKNKGCIRGSCTYSQYDKAYQDLYNQTTDKNATCEDSDGGKDYFVKGIVTYTTKYSSIENTTEDHCFEGTLSEFYCDGNSITYDNYKCDKNCFDGACT